MRQMRSVVVKHDRTTQTLPSFEGKIFRTAEGEHKLWTSVLLCIVHDLSEAGNIMDRAAAERWVGTFPSRDFREVCELAGFDPEAVWSRLHKFCQLPAKERKWPRDFSKRSRQASAARLAEQW